MAPERDDRDVACLGQSSRPAWTRLAGQTAASSSLGKLEVVGRRLRVTAGAEPTQQNLLAPARPFAARFCSWYFL